MVRPGAVRPGERKDLIAIPSPSGPNPVQVKAKDKAQYWAKFYRTHEEEPKALQEKITLMNWFKKFPDVQAILVAYLTYHPQKAEPWMYSALGLAIEENKGKPEETRLSFKYASDLARASHNPNHLVSVADVLYLQKQFDLVGPLLDEAMEKVPHRGEPILMSMNLAQVTRDPKRMASSAEKLLALGWPGRDDVVRREARQRVEKLARTLREEGRPEEADSLVARLPDSEARDLFVRLSWTGDADLDMSIAEPLGATASYQAPRTVFGGAIVKNGYGSHPEEVYVCPRGFDGEYAIKVDTIYNNPEKPATKAILEVITHEGTPQEAKQSHTIALGGKAPAPIVVYLKGGRRKVVLPFVVPPGSTPAPEPTPSTAVMVKDPKAKGVGPATGGPSVKPGTEKR